MIICPNCGQEEYFGTLFCRECGTPLIETGTTTQNLRAHPTQRIAQPQSGARPRQQVASLELRPSQGKPIVLHGTGEWTLGRRSPHSAADIDLTPYQGYEHGVSRMHAAIRITPDGAFVIDLNSSNGTLLNGLKLRPHIPYPLHHGDHLVLGQLAFQIRFRS